MGLTAEQETNLSNFWNVLSNVTHTEPGAPGKELYDSGLVIYKNSSNLSVTDILESLKDRKVISINIDTLGHDKLFTESLFKANQEGQWLIVNLEEDPSMVVIQILKHLNSRNECTLHDLGGQEVVRMELNPDTRIIFLASNNLIEGKITYSYFFELFGPVLRIQ